MPSNFRATRDFELRQLRATVAKANKNARKPRHAGNTSAHIPKPLKNPHTRHKHRDTRHHAMSFPNQPHGGPAGAPPNMAQNFNAMLQRSMDSPQPEHAVEAPGQPPSGPGTAQCLPTHTKACN